MKYNVSLNQYIAAISTLEPQLNVIDIVKNIRRMKIYRNTKYNSMHKHVSRQLKNNKNKHIKQTRYKRKRIKTNIKKVKKAFNKTQGTRKCSVRKIEKHLNNKGINISRGTIHNALKYDLNRKFVHYRRVQRLKPHHKTARVKFAKYLRRKYGATPRSKSFSWDRVIVTDFSKPIRLVRLTNKQNDGILIDKDDDENTILQKGHKKYTPGVMLWGGIYAGGLIPKNAPIFFTDILRKRCKQLHKNKISMTNQIYADFITNDVKKILQKELPQKLSYYIWEDDGATTQRTKHVLSEISNIFPNRIDTKKQADKMANVWVIENVW